MYNEVFGDAKGGRSGIIGFGLERMVLSWIVEMSQGQKGFIRDECRNIWGR